MKKLITMVALAAISFGTVYASDSVKAMQTDTTKKKTTKKDTTQKPKPDTTKKTPPTLRSK